MANMTITEILTGIRDWVNGFHIEGKATKVGNATNGNFAALTSSGDLADSGKKAADFAQAGDVTTLQGKVSTIEGKIPAQASSSNQLADKAFVNSSIATNTAEFRGTYNLVSDLSLTVSATHQQVAAALATKMASLTPPVVPDNNDYAFVQIPVSNDDPTVIASVDRYKYAVSAWEFEYTINNSGFTAAQWAAINSGVTSGDVTKLAALPTNAELTTLLNGKQDVIDDLSTIRSGASAGATAYQKPSSGIPSTDLTSELQSILTNAPEQIQVLAKLCIQQQTLIEGLQRMIYENMGDVKVKTIDSEEIPKVCGQPTIIVENGAPTVPPRQIGQIHVNTSTSTSTIKVAYRVTGSTSDWK